MVEHCTREKEIDELKDEVRRLRDLQFNDHDILIEIKSTVGTLRDSIASLVIKVDAFATQPAKQAEKLKLGAATALITAIISYIALKVLGG